MLTRRTLLQAAAVISAGKLMGPAECWAGGLAGLRVGGDAAGGAGSGDEQRVEVRLVPGAGPVRVPANFAGLGYEMSSAARLGLLSAANAPYVQLVRNLGRHGVLRLGGIVADFTSYAADGTVMAEPKHTVVTRASLQQLRGFLDATGWTAIWSVNFGAGTLAEAITEAKDVAEVLGPRLEALELGNEVENYSRGDHPLRTPPYSFETYRAEYSVWHAALLQAVPGLRFAAPDSAASVEWVERMAADARGEVQLLTTHYYRGSQQRGTLEQLLHSDEELKAHLERLGAAAKSSGIPWRMCETNSFFGGGRPGVSDTLAGALWVLDFMLLLAQSGCAGVNIETGNNQLGFVSSYSPIRDDAGGQVSVGAPYYGMLAFMTALGDSRTMLPVRVSRADVNLAAYALGSPGRVRGLVLINRETTRRVVISTRSLGLKHAKGLYLAGSLLDSAAPVTLGGARVQTSGRWAGSVEEDVRGGMVTLEPGTAVVIRTPGKRDTEKTQV